MRRPRMIRTIIRDLLEKTEPPLLDGGSPFGAEFGAVPVFARMTAHDAAKEEHGFSNRLSC